MNLDFVKTLINSLNMTDSLNLRALDFIEINSFTILFIYLRLLLLYLLFMLLILVKLHSYDLLYAGLWHLVIKLILFFHLISAALLLNQYCFFNAFNIIFLMFLLLLNQCFYCCFFSAFDIIKLMFLILLNQCF